MQNENLEKSIDKLAAHKKTSKKTLFQANWYRYASSDYTLDPEANILTYFITRYCRTKTEREPDNSNRRGYRTLNWEWAENKKFEQQKTQNEKERLFR